jgi:sodium transport system permease protein
MNVARWAVVFRKELMDGSRDRRSLWSVILSAVIGPVLIGVMFTTIAKRERGAEDIRIPVAGAEHAPAFVDWLRQQAGVEVVSAPKDPEAAVRDRKEDVVLIVDKEFAAKFSRSLPAPVKLVNDATQDSARPKVRRIRALLGAYSSQIGSMRLVARGVSPAVASALGIEEIEVSSAQQRAAKILTFFPMFLLLGTLVGGLQLAIDSTAGERERLSLEPLLLNPVSREAIIVGKWLASALFGGVSAVFSSILCTVVVRRIPLQDLGASFRFGAAELAGLLALALPLTLLSSALVIFVALFARSYKEAQTYIGLLPLAYTMPTMILSIFPLQNPAPLWPVPILGQFLLSSEVMGGRAPAAYWYAIVAVTTFVAAVALIALSARNLKRERIVFGR